MKWLLWQQLSKASIFLRDVLHTASVREENMKTETGGRAKQKISAAESIRSASNVPTPGPHHPGLACRPVEKATPAPAALKAALGGWGREPITGATKWSCPSLLAPTSASTPSTHSPSSLPASFAGEHWRQLPTPILPGALIPHGHSGLQLPGDPEGSAKQADMESWGRLVTYMTDNPACLASARPMEAIGPNLQRLLRLSEQPTFVSQREQALLPCSCLYQVSTRDCKDSSTDTWTTMSQTCSYYLLESLS